MHAKFGVCGTGAINLCHTHTHTEREREREREREVRARAHTRTQATYIYKYIRAYMHQQQARFPGMNPQRQSTGGRRAPTKFRLPRVPSSLNHQATGTKLVLNLPYTFRPQVQGFRTCNVFSMKSLKLFPTAFHAHDVPRDDTQVDIFCTRIYSITLHAGGPCLNKSKSASQNRESKPCCQTTLSGGHTLLRGDFA
jgi:hypothetical protein